jgi:hypothetical protein
MSTEEHTERQDETVATERDDDGQQTVTAQAERPGTDDGSELVPLLEQGESDEFRSRWTEIQAGFVDDPREMVERADHLVADLMQQLASQFSEERSRLESQWDSDDDVSTEELRVTLTRYRSFFNRLLEA